MAVSGGYVRGLRSGPSVPVSTPLTRTRPKTFGEQNAEANAGIYEPGSFGEQNNDANLGLSRDQDSFAAQNLRANAVNPDAVPLARVPPGPSTAILAARTAANNPSIQRNTGAPLPPQQTERANPLVGDVNAQPEDTTATVGTLAQSAGQALGFNSRGAKTPAGLDAAASPNTGGSGLYSKVFSNPRAASVYDGYVRTLFGDD